MQTLTHEGMSQQVVAGAVDSAGMAHVNVEKQFPDKSSPDRVDVMSIRRVVPSMIRSVSAKHSAPDAPRRRELVERSRVDSSRALGVTFGCMLLALACKEDSRPFDYQARMFVAEEDSSGLFLCFATDAALAPGTPVTVVFTGAPQHFTVGRLGLRKKIPCIPPSPSPPADSMQYTVEIPHDTLDRRGIPIVILGDVPTPQQHGDTVTIATERVGPPVRFRDCASNEGLHATAWAGVPLASLRVWHAYYYLGYDVDPTCSEAESADSSGKSAGTP